MDDNLFDAMGSCDGFSLDPNYKKSRVVKARHYTSNDIPIDDTCPVVFIKHCNQLKFDYMWMVNFFFKVNFAAGGYKDKTKERSEELVSDYKGNWVDALSTRKLHIGHGMFKEYNAPNDKFDFDFAAFFSLQAFLIELQHTAKFLNRKLVVDDSLIQLWYAFIEKNQGYQQYTKASALLDSIANGDSVVIEDNWQIHAYINKRLPQMFNIWDGLLFEDVPYPTNTKEIYDLIKGI